MMGHSRGGALAAYQSVAAHGGVAASDAHGLVLMLLDGLQERISAAHLAIQNSDFDAKARFLNRSLGILGELRRALDFEAGGALARNLDALYDYCTRQLLVASVELRTEPLDEVSRLVNEIRIAWMSVRSEGPRR